ncbi:ribulose bisphosphate carboxylase large chain [Medicago truncatula]|uniref:Uncharacterized protein ycf72 n=1 Tax=Medicago truncatula TaxID=3880 RepID=G7JRM2_MEDTR|nr:ribulose bisphosphate carboxylase large chain [Medicago truncatula]
MSGGDHINASTVVGKLEGERDITLGFVDLLRDDFVEKDRSRSVRLAICCVLSTISTEAPPWADSSFRSSAYGVLAAVSSCCSPPKDIKRTSPEGNFNVADFPSFAISFATAPAALANCPPFPSVISMLCMAAGRNLPDKEFRYLRTVIVTAAVHRGFGRRLPCHQVTNFLNLPALGRPKKSPGPIVKNRELLFSLIAFNQPGNHMLRHLILFDKRRVVCLGICW